MADRRVKIGSCLLLAILAATPIQAQESSWGLRVFPFAGLHLPERNLGKNAVEIEAQSALQVVATVENSPTLGGGFELLVGDHNIRIRGQFATTVGATARGVLGLCESGRLEFPGRGLCELDLETDAQILDGTAELVFLTGAPNRFFRPTISFGLGVRSFDFNPEALDCDAYGGPLDDDWQVCNRSREIMENPSVNPSLTFGVGLEADRDLLSGFVRLNALTASYTGGSGLADGGRQVDLFVVGGIAVGVRYAPRTKASPRPVEFVKETVELGRGP